MFPAEGVNWIWGGNGAGKTSLLEAMFVLARGRSFRSQKHGPMLRDGSQDFSVRVKLFSEGRSGTLELFSQSGRKIVLDNGSRVLRRRDLFKKIRVRVVGENAQALLVGDPAIRRKFLDWNLFHVEPRYFELYTSLRRTLIQRNAWLRKGARGPRVWDEEYVSLAEEVTQLRAKFVGALTKELVSFPEVVAGAPALRAELDPGWDRNESLGDALNGSFRRDCLRGYTNVGPGKADVRVSADGMFRARSRGEMKVAVCLLQYAAERLCENAVQDSCIWLLDDLPAELDTCSALTIWDVLRSGAGQIFATARRVDSDLLRFCRADTFKVFHVERGAVYP